MTKVEDKSLCIQRCFFEELSSPLLNRMERKGGMNFDATGMTKESLTKAVYTAEPTPVGETFSA